MANFPPPPPPPVRVPIFSEFCFEIFPTCNNPVDLIWLTPQGGDCYFQFDTVQEYAITTSSLDSFAPYIPDIDPSEYRAKPLGKESVRQIRLYRDNLRAVDMQALSTIFESVRIQMLNGYNDDGSPRWLQVTVAPESRSIYRTNRSKGYKFELTINLPQEYTQYE